MGPEEGEDIPLTVPCESWSVDSRPPKGAEVVKVMTTAIMQCRSKRRAWGEEVAQSLSLILSHPSGIERAQIPSDWVHKGQGL